jgi:hypothetical protein
LNPPLSLQTFSGNLPTHILSRRKLRSTLYASITKRQAPLSLYCNRYP